MTTPTLLAEQRVNVFQIASSVYQWFVCSQVKLLVTGYFTSCVSKVTRVEEREYLCKPILGLQEL